jgi:hypothetical protein
VFFKHVSLRRRIEKTSMIADFCRDQQGSVFKFMDYPAGTKLRPENSNDGPPNQSRAFIPRYTYSIADVPQKSVTRGAGVIPGTNWWQVTNRRVYADLTSVNPP